MTEKVIGAAAYKMDLVAKAQLLTCLRASGKRFDLLINCNVMMLKDGIQKVINGYESSPCDLRVLRGSGVK